jgi:hypothetical protein
MRVTAVPRNARSGRRTTFAFRVTSANGRPVSGAVVRLAGQRAVTGRRGRASITLMLRHPGRWIVRVTRAGYRPATAAIIVQPAPAHRGVRG